MTAALLNSKKKTQFFFIADTLLVILAFTIVAWWKPATKEVVLPHYDTPFLCFLCIWITSSIVTGKYNFQGKAKLSHKIRSIIIADIAALAIGLTLLSLLEITDYSRLMVFGTIGLSFIFELLILPPILAYEKANRTFTPEHSLRARKEIKEDYYKERYINRHFSQSIKQGIVRLVGEDIYNFIEKHITNDESDIHFTATRRAFNIETIADTPQAIVNLQQINTVPDINSLFRATNYTLPEGGIYVLIGETIKTRKEKILNRTFIPINYIHYFFDYIYHRVLAKVYPTRLLYKSLKHNNRAISRAELLGRLYAAGFVVIDEGHIDDAFVCITQKVKAPLDLDYETIGGLIKLKRYGKGKKIIGVYKFRTMHPYSEFIQEYIYEKNSLNDGGKFKDDFRVNTVGKYLRKMWLDELPMFINFFKGEMKLVGVRPLSEHYFNLYTKELQDLRTSTKPGLLPPFYADTPVTLDEIMESEIRYLKAYKKHPIRTDIKYFFKILNNIFIKRRRSE